MSEDIVGIRNIQLSLLKGKPCLICGQPSSCAVVDGTCLFPACMTHGFMAQKLSYLVYFPKIKQSKKTGVSK